MSPLALTFFLLTAHQGAGSIIADGAKLQKLGGGYLFTEGSCSDPKGNVYFTDQPNDRILRWNIDGTVEIWKQPCGRSNGTFLDKKGNLIACADENNELWSIAPNGNVTVLMKNFEGKAMNGPNDVWVRPDGGMYITDPLYVRPYWTRRPETQQKANHVFYLRPGGTVLRNVVDDLKTPNGIIGTPNGRTLYVSDIDGGMTYRYAVQKDGSLQNKELFCKLGSDGMTLDLDGNVYLTGKGVTVFDRTGHQIEHIDIPEEWVGHVCFGGKDHRMLFIAASKGIYGMQMKVKGAY